MPGDAVSAGVSPGSAGSLVRRRIADVRCGSHVPGDVSKQHQTMQRLDALVALRDSPTLPAPSLTGRSGRCTQARVVARRGSLPARSVGWRRLFSTYGWCEVKGVAHPVGTQAAADRPITKGWFNGTLANVQDQRAGSCCCRAKRAPDVLPLRCIR
jgi:hypothetical protein